MEAHFADNITLDTLLDMCGYGKTYLRLPLPGRQASPLTAISRRSA